MCVDVIYVDTHHLKMINTSLNIQGFFPLYTRTCRGQFYMIFLDEFGKLVSYMQIFGVVPPPSTPCPWWPQTKLIQKSLWMCLQTPGVPTWKFYPYGFPDCKAQRNCKADFALKFGREAEDFVLVNLVVALVLQHMQRKFSVFFFFWIPMNRRCLFLILGVVI